LKFVSIRSEYHNGKQNQDFSPNFQDQWMFFSGLVKIKSSKEKKQRNLIEKEFFHE